MKNRSKMFEINNSTENTNLNNISNNSLVEYFKKMKDQETVKFLKNINEKKISKTENNNFEQFMTIALWTAQNSPDPDCQVGACIVKENKLLLKGQQYLCGPYLIGYAYWEEAGNPVLREGDDPNGKNGIRAIIIVEVNGDLNAILYFRCL